MLFARLAVFAGWFRLEAVAACCARGLAGHNVLNLLGGLVDKSLLVADPSGPVTRYRLLETIRAYAEAKLAADEVDDATRAAHCEWFLAQLEQIPWDERLLSPGLEHRLEDQRDDLRRAMRWAEEQQRHDLVARLVASMSAVLAFDSNTEEVQRLLAIAIEFERLATTGRTTRHRSIGVQPRLPLVRRPDRTRDAPIPPPSRWSSTCPIGTRSRRRPIQRWRASAPGFPTSGQPWSGTPTSASGTHRPMPVDCKPWPDARRPVP